MGKVNWTTFICAVLFSCAVAHANDLVQIEALFKKGAAAKAKEKIAEFLSKNDNAIAYEKIGAMYARQKNWVEAIHYLEIANNRQPNKSVLRYKLGIAYHQGKNLEKSIEQFRKAISLDPKFLKAVFALAEIMESSDNNYEARQVYQQAIKDSGENGELRAKLCIFDFKEAFWKDAVNNCTKAVGKNHKNTIAWSLLSVSLFELQQRDKAFNEFKKAMVLNPNSSILHKSRGLLFFREKSYEQAAQDLGRAAGLDSLDDETLIHLARVLYELGRYSDARVVYSEVCKLDKAFKFEFQSKQKELLRKGQATLAKEYQESIDLIKSH